MAKKKYAPVSEEIEQKIELLKAQKGISGMDVDDLSTFFTEAELSEISSDISDLLLEEEQKSSFFAKGLRKIISDLNEAIQLSREDSGIEDDEA